MTTQLHPSGVVLPTMKEARDALSIYNRLDQGTYRAAYWKPGSFWVFKYGNCLANEADFKAAEDLRLEIAASTGFEWVGIPEVHLMEDPHWLAMEYIPRLSEADEYFDWCDYYAECNNTHCRRHAIEDRFNLEDMHDSNVIKSSKDGLIYLIDLAGSLIDEDCCGEEYEIQFSPDEDEGW